MVIPVGRIRARQELYLFEKENGELNRQSAVLPVVFVPMKRETESR